MMLTKDGEELQLEINVLSKKVEELNKQIFVFNKENETKLEQIESIENSIKSLGEKAKEKNWKLTFFNVITLGTFRYFRTKGINKQIQKLKFKTKNLSEEISDNETNKQPLLNNKITILEKINASWQKLWNKNQTNTKEMISNQLNLIIQNQQSDKRNQEITSFYPTEKNPFEIDEGFSTTSDNNISTNMEKHDNFDSQSINSQDSSIVVINDSNLQKSLSS